MNRRLLIIAPLLAGSWYAMMLVHEFGHVIAAWITGSQIQSVRVPWVGFSQTLVPATQWPRVVTASGPVVGAMLPLLTWLIARHIPCLSRRGWSVIARFFAAFCLLANGVYLGSAMLNPVGDTEELVRVGVPAWVLTTIGLPAAALGLALWNGMAMNLDHAADAEARHARVTLRQSLAWLACVLVVVGIVNLVP
ncbi:MAG: hypothetical protein IT432_11565 [Phycisphaerales bacterium]|nr:hypothetical protein [Phycisphaerales bacterium]